MTLSNLPVQLTSFIGRQDDLSAVRQLLSAFRLVTLVGPGGSGKTRLALESVSQISGTFTDGLWLAELASLHEPALVPQFVAQVLGLHPSSDLSPVELLLTYIGAKQVLLILDNCEHLADACAELILQLLSQSPNLRILATSREALAIPGEGVYPLSGLPYPTLNREASPNGQCCRDAQELINFDAVNLLVERGRAISPQFGITPENAPALVEVCRRLDGMPLALELASARLNVLTIQEIAGRLNDRFSLLIAETRRGVDPRHQTLRAAIDWSYDLLSTKEQTLLRRLAVFAAGCTLETAEYVCSGEGIAENQILGLLSSLVDKSFILAETIGRAQARYSMLETIREYALNKLNQSGEAARLRDRHLDLFTARAEEVSPKLTGSYQQLWLNWLEGELDNLRAALAWSLESGRIESGLRIDTALEPFWDIRGYMRECLVWYQRLLPRMDDTIPVDVRVNALVNAAYISMADGNVQANMTYGREAIQAAEAVGDQALLALALNSQGVSAQMTGDFQTSFTVIERAIPLYRESGPPYYLRMALYLAGEHAVQLGYYQIARERLSESLALCHQEGDSYHIANNDNALGDLARLEGNYVEAAGFYENAEVLLRELGAQNDLASALSNLGFTYAFLGRIEQARTCFDECVAIHLAQQNRHGLVECLIGYGAAAVKCGLTASGARLLLAATTISGLPSVSHWRATRMEFERYSDLSRTRLTESEYLAEQSAGRSMSLEQALDYAEQLPLESSPEPMAAEIPGGLTVREREIASLIGRGMSNGEIAAALVLSKRTVETHISHILSKLGLEGRTQIMLWVLDHGMPKHPIR